MSDIISESEIRDRIEGYERKWPEFAEIYSTPTCCPGCMIPYDRWGFDQLNDWQDYYSLRWLRGDEIRWESHDE